MSETTKDILTKIRSTLDQRDSYRAVTYKYNMVVVYDADTQLTYLVTVAPITYVPAAVLRELQ